MSDSPVLSGYVDIDQSRLYYETAGSGIPLLMVHAGIADCEQWENEFLDLSRKFRVVRYDMRGYGKSDPVQGPFSHVLDLQAVIEQLQLPFPLIIMGCSMGGVLSMEYAIEHPANIQGLIMIGPGPCGFEMEGNEQELFLDAMKAFKEGDLNRLAEIETQIWFDSMESAPDQVDQSMRALLYDMHRSARLGDAIQPGEPVSDTSQPEYAKLSAINFPVLIIIGSQDLSAMHAAADYLTEEIPLARKVVIDDAAHLPNLDQPHQCQEVVEEFLDEITSEQDYDTMFP
jgi:pimeloyl-ACP methyl ester carboxylesterase